MKNFGTKIDNDETSAGVVVADEYNSIFSENKGAITPFTGLNEADNKQLAKSIDIASKAMFYTDTGTPNAVQLSRGATTETLETLFDGMVIMFTPANANTGATTLKIKTLTAKPLYMNGAILVSGFLKIDETYTAKYNQVDDRFDIVKTYSAGTAGTSVGSGILSQGFVKPDNKIPLLVKTNANSFKIPAGTSVVVGENTTILEGDAVLSLDTNLDTGVKTAGTDYCVYAVNDGTFYISADDTIMADRLIGGFHYGLTGESEVATGNKTASDMAKLQGINSYSFWDLKFKPIASPKGMVYINGRWYDIYLCNSEHITNGTSKAGATIAGGTTDYGRARPKIPLEYGGDGNVDYGSFKWFHTTEIAKSHSKELISYEEFMAIAYGVNEGKSSSTNSYETIAGKIEHYSELTSKFGIEQATGTQWIWGKDVGGNRSENSTSWAWRTGLTENRGDIYALHNNHITAVLLGAHRGHGINAGSRASRWYNYVWSSGWSIGSRFACDHLELV